MGDTGLIILFLLLLLLLKFIKPLQEQLTNDHPSGCGFFSTRASCSAIISPLHTHVELNSSILSLLNINKASEGSQSSNEPEGLSTVCGMQPSCLRNQEQTNSRTFTK